MKFVIEYIYDEVAYDVIWKGDSAGQALESFWNSYDAKSKEKVSDVEIYSLLRIPVLTQVL